jgi:hypothetical protein
MVYIDDRKRNTPSCNSGQNKEITMAQSIFKTPYFLKEEDIFDDIMDTDPEETAVIHENELRKDADLKINKLLQFLQGRITQFREGVISSSDLCCEMFRLSALINDEVHVYVRP